MSSTLSAQAKKLSQATGYKHTECLRAIQSVAGQTTNPNERQKLAHELLQSGATPHQDLPIGSTLLWGRAGSGKTVLAQHIAKKAAANGARIFVLSQKRHVFENWEQLADEWGGTESPDDLTDLLRNFQKYQGTKLLVVDETEALGVDVSDVAVCDKHIDTVYFQELLLRVVERSPGQVVLTSILGQHREQPACRFLIETGNVVALGRIDKIQSLLLQMGGRTLNSNARGAGLVRTGTTIRTHHPVPYEPDQNLIDY